MRLLTQEFFSWYKHEFVNFKSVGNIFPIKDKKGSFPYTGHCNTNEQSGIVWQVVAFSLLICSVIWIYQNCIDFKKKKTLCLRCILHFFLSLFCIKIIHILVNQDKKNHWRTTLSGKYWQFTDHSSQRHSNSWDHKFSFCFLWKLQR